MFDQQSRPDGKRQRLRQAVRTAKLSAGILATSLFASASVFATEVSPTVSPLSSAGLGLQNSTLSPLETENIPSGIPLSLMQLRGDYRYALAVDLSANQMFVFANNKGTPELVGSYYATIGKEGFGKQREGDNRTPVGVYRIQQFIDDKSLPELYGSGALPLDFPNAWDRKQGRTGHGIWIHGMPRDQERRPPRDSEGCVVVSNAVLPNLRSWSELKSTPVILADQLRWADPMLVDSARNALLDSVGQWRDAWATGDMDTFLGMHSPKFRTRTQRFKNYAAQKRRLAEQRGKVNVHLEEFEVFMYPDVDHKAMAMVSFKQRYDSSQFKDVTYKTQYWQHNGDNWELQLERNVAAWPSQPLNGKMVAHAKTD